MTKQEEINPVVKLYIFCLGGNIFTKMFRVLEKEDINEIMDLILSKVRSKKNGKNKKD